MDPEKQKLVNVQSLLWVGYSVCAAISCFSHYSDWTLALLVTSLSVLPVAYLNYVYIPDNAPYLERSIRILWMCVTSIVLFLFGVCAHIEGLQEPWPAKIGTGFYVIAVVYPHMKVFDEKIKEEMKNKTLFLIYMNLSTVLYTTAAFFLALSPSFVGWKLLLPVTAFFSWMVAYPFFNRSNRSGPFTAFFRLPDYHCRLSLRTGRR